jgi:Ca2+-transporting ATPase
MTVRAVATPGGRVEFTDVGYDPQGTVLHAGHPLHDPILLDEVETILRAASLVNNAALLLLGGKWTIQGAPTEGALQAAARKFGLQKKDLEGRYLRREEVPFSSSRKLMSTAHEDTTRDEHVLIFSKGAPDVLLARCTSEQSLTLYHVSSGTHRPGNAIESQTGDDNHIRVR